MLTRSPVRSPAQSPARAVPASDWSLHDLPFALDGNGNPIAALYIAGREGNYADATAQSPTGDGDDAAFWTDHLGGGHSQVFGPELVTNGSFDTDLSGWSASGNWAWSAGGADHPASGGGENLQTEDVVFEAGKVYEVGWDQSGGFVAVYADGLGILISNTNTDYSYAMLVESVNGGKLTFRANDACAVDNTTVREHPVSYLRPVGGEQVTNGGFDTDTVWGKNAGATISGGVGNLPASNASLGQSLPGLRGKKVRVKIKTNKSGGSQLRITMGGDIVSQENYETGTHEIDVTFGSASDTLDIRSAGFVGSIDDVSVEVLEPITFTGLGANISTYDEPVVYSSAPSGTRQQKFDMAVSEDDERWFVEFEVYDHVSGGVYATFFNNTIPTVYSDGWVRGILKGNTGTQFSFVAVGATTLKIRNISVKHISGYHAVQTSTPNAPTIVNDVYTWDRVDDQMPLGTGQMSAGETWMVAMRVKDILASAGYLLVTDGGQSGGWIFCAQPSAGTLITDHGGNMRVWFDGGEYPVNWGTTTRQDLLDELLLNETVIVEQVISTTLSTPTLGAYYASSAFFSPNFSLGLFGKITRSLTASEARNTHKKLLSY